MRLDPPREMIVRLREQVRAEVRRVPALARARRAARRRLRRRLMAPLVVYLGRSLVMLGVALAAANASSQTTLGLLGWLLGIFCCFRAAEWVRNRGPNTEAAVWYSWPVPAWAVWDRMAAARYRLSVWSAVDVVVVLGVHAYVQGMGGAALAVAVLWGGVAYAFNFGLAVAMARWLPRIPWGSLAVFGCLALFVAVRGLPESGSWHAWSTQVLTLGARATPGGWLAQGWLQLAGGQAAGLLWIPLAIMAMLGGRAQVRLWRARYSPEAWFDPREDELAALGVDADETGTSQQPGAGLGQPDPRLTRDSAERAVAELASWREAPPAATLRGSGVIAATAVRVVPARWLPALDAMRPDAGTWDRRWLAALAVVLLLRMAGAAGILTPMSTAWAGVVIAAGLACPIMGGTWFGLRAAPVWGGVSRAAVVSCLPLGFVRMVVCFCGVQAVRVVLALPLLLLAVQSLYPREALGAAGWLVLRAGLAAVAIQPVSFVISISSLTNDTDISWRSILVGMPVVLVFGVAWMFGLLAAFVLEPLAVQVAGLAALILGSLVATAAYGRAWGRGWFDVQGRGA